MSVRKLTASLLTTLALLGGLATASAQYAPHDVRHLAPPADPFAFDPDFQWFKPVYDVDLTDMKPSKRAHYGWFATYDRLNLYVSRPELDDRNVSETLLDGGWGNRYEIGYMIPNEDTGWMFTYLETGVGQFVGGVGEVIERLNRFNEGDLEGEPENPGPPFGFQVPQADSNTRGFNTRILFLQDSENVLDFDDYELNKIWRMEPYHYGGILEPMIGIRWMTLEDVNTKQFYQNTLEDTVEDIRGFDDAESIETDTTLTENEMLAAQLGFRYTKFRDRFTYAADFRVFAGANWQSSLSKEFLELVVYDGAGAGSEIDNIIYEYGTPIYSRNEEFVLGFDVRGELNYQLTRDITVRGGFQLIDLARGIWRGGSKDPSRNLLNGGDSDQDVLMVGATFGLTINR